MMKTQYTHYTPIPPQVPRQLAIEILQSHGEVITVNPLVLDYHPIKAPRDCPNDEYYSTWYEISQRIQFVPGLKKVGSGKVTFKGCFHDMPWGVQTHMYIPMGVDLRNKWQIRGTQAGEQPEPRELGSDAPPSGLYLREDVEIKCNPLALSFVKKEMRAASLVMVERMIKKAELLDAGVLQAMFEGGKLKTLNPNDRSSKMSPPSPVSPSPYSPATSSRWGPDNASQPPRDNRESTYSTYHQLHNREAPNQLGQVPHPEGQGLAVEMPGDYLYPTTQAPRVERFSDRYSQASGSEYSSGQRDSRYSVVSDQHSNGGTPRFNSNTNSPAVDPKHFSAELPGSGHTDFEVRGTSTPPRHTPQQQQYSPPTYNPQNYANQSRNGY